mgnify:CR=1 FL=1
MGSLTKDKKLGILAAIIGAGVIIYSSQIEPLMELEEPGPKLFPMISGAGILICGLCIFFRKQTKEDRPFADKAGWKRMAELFLILVIYVFIGLEYIGYLISTPILLVVLFWVLAEPDKKPKKWFCVAMGVGIGLFLYLFFHVLVELQLPKGVLLPALGLNF